MNWSTCVFSQECTGADTKGVRCAGPLQVQAPQAADCWQLCWHNRLLAQLAAWPSTRMQGTELHDHEGPATAPLHAQQHVYTGPDTLHTLSKSNKYKQGTVPVHTEIMKPAHATSQQSNAQLQAKMALNLLDTNVFVLRLRTVKMTATVPLSIMETPALTWSLMWSSSPQAVRQWGSVLLAVWQVTTSQHHHYTTFSLR